MKESGEQADVLLLVENRFVAMSLTRRLRPLVRTVVECYDREDLRLAIESAAFDVCLVAERAMAFDPIDEIPRIIHQRHPSALVICAAMAEQADELQDAGFDNLYPRDWYGGNTYLPQFVLGVVTGTVDSFLPSTDWLPSIV